MFDTLSHLSNADADLFFCIGHCFICWTVTHCSERCSVWSPPIILCKHLDYPHHMYHPKLIFGKWLTFWRNRMGWHLSQTWQDISMCKGTSVHFLTSPRLSYSPLVHMYSPHTSVPSPGTTPTANDFHIQKSNNFLDVDSRKVIGFLPLPPLVPQQHWMSLRRIGTRPRDTTAPSAVTWMAINRRLGTGRLGTVILSISFVVWPSQGSLECSLWISPG
jgi:hypothetical protein